MKLLLLRFMTATGRSCICMFFGWSEMRKNRKTLFKSFSVRSGKKKETIQSTNIGGYLYVAARNKVLNLVQQNKVRSDYLTSLGKFSHEMSNVTLEQIDEKDLAQSLEREIAKLPDKMRIIFELSRKENLSHKEIALKLGLSDKTVKKQVSNALKLIRNNLGVTGASILWLIFLR
ncbi:sigma-70 family RNA polymerase sigma factor [Pedobacter sp. NJ-S-72]